MLKKYLEQKPESPAAGLVAGVRFVTRSPGRPEKPGTELPGKELVGSGSRGWTRVSIVLSNQAPAHGTDLVEFPVFIPVLWTVEAFLSALTPGTGPSNTLLLR